MKTPLVMVFLNSALLTSFLSWLTAQGAKVLCHLAITHRINLHYLVGTGGMPSAHSALVCGLTTSIGWQCGWGSPIFALALGFAGLTMFDASTVRRAAGQQARLLNEIIDELFKEQRFSERKLKELLGHTRLEVLMGAIIGVLIGVIVQSLATVHAGA